MVNVPIRMLHGIIIFSSTQLYQSYGPFNFVKQFFNINLNFFLCCHEIMLVEIYHLKQIFFIQLFYYQDFTVFYWSEFLQFIYITLITKFFQKVNQYIFQFVKHLCYHCYHQCDDNPWLLNVWEFDCCSLSLVDRSWSSIGEQQKGDKQSLMILHTTQ